jgi:hypothetical protein
MEREQVGVSSEYEISAAVDCQFQKFIVFGITTRSHLLRYWDHLRSTANEADELISLFNCYVTIELRPRQYIS